MNSNPTRSLAGSCRGNGITTFAPGTKLINMIVNDDDVGIQVNDAAQNSEVYGTLIYNMGTIDTTRGTTGTGHGMYVHMTAPSTLRIVDNIIVNGFDMGIQAYASDQGHSENMTIQGNTLVENGVLDNTDNGHGGIQLLVGSTNYP